MFSGTVKILDIDDYIKPSQECIKPIMAKDGQVKGIKIADEEFKNEVKLQKPRRKDQDIIDLYSDTGGIRPDLIKQTAQSTAQISLTDCLACSGCVTTAETILIQEHNAEDFMNKIKTYKYSVVSIAPQARASLAQFFKTNDLNMQYALILFFKELGVKYFWDQSLAINIAVQQAQQEYLERYQTYLKEGKKKDILPLLCSECPGWVCYAEKVAGEEVIPYMSRVKSPQQIMGVIAKELMPHILNTSREEIYCATIEPCYDKKLEATRAEFSNNGIRDVDTVLSPNEMIDIIAKVKIENNIDLAQIVARVEKSAEDMTFLKTLQENPSIEQFLSQLQEFSDLPNTKTDLQNRTSSNLTINSTEKANSNSYAETIMRNSLKELYSSDYDRIQFEYKLGKNSDLEECKVTLDDKELMTFARVYGLRNIQTVARNVKKGISRYHYIEVMACPSGCVNGGALLKPDDKSIKAKDLASILYTIMTDLNCKTLYPSANDIIAEHTRKPAQNMAQPLINLSANFAAVEKSAAAQLKW